MTKTQKENTAQETEIIENGQKISCEGENHPYDHPKVYLEIPNGKNEVACPYCGKVFKSV